MNYRLYPGLIVLCLIICTISCSIKESAPDQIMNEKIDKKILIDTPDSITGSCRQMVFSIAIDDTLNTTTTVMHINNAGYYCDAHSEIMAMPGTNRLNPLPFNSTVNSDGNWIAVNNISLDDFAGKGLKYAGYRIADYSSGEVVYFYGWIGIEVDFNKLKITIAERATNYTANKPIMTGQQK